ncbi:MAG: GrpB family protein, partial [Ktedonobacterales bacterium]|nr:GrpB family protein [Ktedonobacterales bacterium]
MITIVAYDPQWPAEFQRIAAPLRTALGAQALRIDHIGSTAVPGLAAKDKIDIQVTLHDLTNTAAVVAMISALGYQPFGALITLDHCPPGANGPASDWQKSLLTSFPDGRPPNIHIRASGRPN